MRRRRTRDESINFDEGLEKIEFVSSRKPRRVPGEIKGSAPVPNQYTRALETMKIQKRDMTADEFAAESPALPPVLTWGAVHSGTLPDDGSGLPASLERDVPPAFRFWKCSDRSDALAVREALVESGIFTDKTIRVVNGELRRVTTKQIVKVYLAPEYDDAEPVVVPELRRSVEKVAIKLAASESKPVIFPEDVVSVVGIDTIVQRVQKLDAWLIAATDSAEVRKSLIGPAFKYAGCADLIFATNLELVDESGITRIAVDRDELVLKTVLSEDHEVRMIKSSEERIVFGVVLEPDEVDSQNDTVPAHEIEKAAYRFMEEFRNLGKQHKELVNGKLVLLESYIAPIDFEIEGQKVKKGTWLLKERVVDDSLWEAVKAGKFTGFSIGGSAVRRKV